MRSALYEGAVRHRRFVPAPHGFRRRVAMAYVDLAELGPGGALDGILATRRGALLRFERRDYLGPPDVPLDTAVRDLVERRTGIRPLGPVRMLAQLRTAGWNFNPITLYYCLSRDGTRLEAVVFEVTSTPWAERAAYVVRAGSDGRVRDARMSKVLHVSPFMPMDLEYRFSCGLPAERLSVRFELWRGGARYFDADLWCARAAPLDRRGIRRLLVRHPLMPLVVSASIYVEAVRLLRARVPFHPHPGTRAGRAAAGAPSRPPAGPRRAVAGREVA
ncbi:MAG TPA: DUF1365 domain-containing protein [Acidimicrobiales bacterium]|nr:DUF1365 domain-containing protein [Acidimicrobiales bacterium]